MNVDTSPMDTATGMDQAALANMRRPRSHSYYSAEDAKQYGETAEAENIHIRPRSRSFYSYETSESHSDGDLTRANASRSRELSLLLSEGSKKQKNGEGIMTRLLSKRMKASVNKNNASKDISGTLKLNWYFFIYLITL